jgi:hypothetical protein
MAPGNTQSFSFSGLRATGQDLEGSLDISGEAIVVYCPIAFALQPTPMEI